jgi:hypothetical protein
VELGREALLRDFAVRVRRGGHDDRVQALLFVEHLADARVGLRPPRATLARTQTRGVRVADRHELHVVELRELTQHDAALSSDAGQADLEGARKAQRRSAEFRSEGEKRAAGDAEAGLLQEISAAGGHVGSDSG